MIDAVEIVIRGFATDGELRLSPTGNRLGAILSFEEDGTYAETGVVPY
jgi:hypothetical protein